MILPRITKKMNNDETESKIIIQIIEALSVSHHISLTDCIYLLDHISLQELPFLMKKAREVTDVNYGKDVFFRGLIEMTNVCSQGC